MIAHIAGLPLEETAGSFAPALLVASGVAWAKLLARLRPARSRATAHVPSRHTEARRAEGRPQHLERHARDF